MASLDVSLHPVAITIILLTVYACSFFGLVARTLTLLQRVILQGQVLYEGVRVKEQRSERTAPSVNHLGDFETIVHKESKFSASWWTDDQVLQLERRAIFSKTWIYVTHRSRFSNPGDYLTLRIAGFSFFLILGKDQILRAFHNVCRHRAYEVTRKECGSSTVLGCRYHGWSYDTRGQLIKAPEFDTVPGFEKKENGLWEIHTKVSTHGLVFVNLDAAKRVKEPDFEEMEVETQKLEILESERAVEWTYVGAFNWKLAAAGSLARDDEMRQLKDIQKEKFWELPKLLGICRHSRERKIHISLTTTMHLYPSRSCWLVTKILPQSTSKTTVQCELYVRTGHKPKRMEDFVRKLKEASFAEIQQFQLIQKRLIEDSLTLDKSQEAQQDVINTLLNAHRKSEYLAGKEIYPAARQTRLSREGQEDDDLCRELERTSAQMVSACLNTPSLPKSKSLDW